MNIEQAIAFANAADDRWQTYLDAAGLNRWSAAASYRGSRAGELYEAKVIADAMLRRAFEQGKPCSR